MCTRTHCERRSKFAVAFSRLPIGGSYPRHADTNFGEKNASGRRESAPQSHDWKKIWDILKPQNFHGSENFLEMILPLHISLEVLY